MPSPETPGSSTSNSSRQRCRHRPSPSSDRLGTPKIPAIRFAQGVHFVAYTVHTFATACQVACPPVRIRPASRPSGTFTTRLPTGRSPFPLLVITTTATGLLCWWDLHPLEWQLASLHQNSGHRVSQKCPVRPPVRQPLQLPLRRRACPASLEKQGRYGA